MKALQYPIGNRRWVMPRRGGRSMRDGIHPVQEELEGMQYGAKSCTRSAAKPNGGGADAPMQHAAIVHGDPIAAALPCTGSDTISIHNTTIRAKWRMSFNLAYAKITYSHDSAPQQFGNQVPDQVTGAVFPTQPYVPEFPREIRAEHPDHLGDVTGGAASRLRFGNDVRLCPAPGGSAIRSRSRPRIDGRRRRVQPPGTRRAREPRYARGSSSGSPSPLG